MTPNTLWISVLGTLFLIFSVTCSHKNQRRRNRKVASKIGKWISPNFHNDDKFKFTTEKSTLTFIHRKRSYSDIDFENISATLTFVDKTMMLEKFFESYPHHIVTLPRKFGKTTNLDMIYRFARIELDKTGKATDKQLTESHSLFSYQMEIFKRRRDIIQNHLAEYPVLYLNMVGFFIGLRESNERMDSMSHILKWCIAEYQSLLDDKSMSNRTHGRAFEFARKAFDKQLSYVDMQNSLYEFSRILRNHFNKKVILLMDEFDYPFNSAVSKDLGYEMIELVVIMLDRLFHPLDDECHVAYTLITGISNTMATMISSKVPEIQHRRAFENHIFAPFYGITAKELEGLLSHPKLSNADRLRIPEYYSGYLIRGTKKLLANTYSVTEYIKEDCTRFDPWFSHQSISTFVDFLKNGQIYQYMLQLVFLNVIEIQLLPYLSLKHLNELWQIEQGQKDAVGFDARVFFSFFFEYGYLSYTERENHYRMPSQEICDGLKNFIMQFYDSTSQQKTNLNDWDEKHSLKNIFESDHVTDEMLLHLKNAFFHNLIEKSESYNLPSNLKPIHYQSLIYYTARKSLDDIQVHSDLYDDIEKPIYIVKINFQTKMALFLGLSEDESGETILQRLYKYAIPYQTKTPCKMVKYIGINLPLNAKDAPEVVYNYGNRSIDAENNQDLLTSTTLVPVTRRRRRKRTRSTASNAATFPQMPKEFWNLFWADGKPPAKR